MLISIFWKIILQDIIYETDARKNDSGTQPLKSLQYKGVYSIDTLFVQNRSASLAVGRWPLAVKSVPEMKLKKVLGFTH